tara:strand:- start:3794 stop:4012 length:219 start_codon:yes stop_codon:yes gene_type:complete
MAALNVRNVPPGPTKTLSGLRRANLVLQANIKMQSLKAFVIHVPMVKHQSKAQIVLSAVYVTMESFWKIMLA